MHMDRKFDPGKLAKLNDPGRLEYLSPDVIWNRIGLGNPASMIDIGAGTGFFSLLFSERAPAAKVYACDISDQMIGWMEEHLPPEAKERIMPVLMEESRVPLEDACADLVYMINLHHELDEPVEIAREAHRLLRPGGRLAIIDWRKGESPAGPPDEIRVTEEAVESHMKEAGFVEIQKSAELPYHVFIMGQK